MTDSAYFDSTPFFSLTVVLSAVVIGLVVALWYLCPQITLDSADMEGLFRAPAVPLLPCVAIIVNWALLAQLSALGLCLITGWITLGLFSYFAYGYNHSLSHTFALFESLSGTATPKSIKASFIKSFSHENEHYELDTDLYRAPVRQPATGQSGWIYSNRQRAQSFFQTPSHYHNLDASLLQSSKPEPSDDVQSSSAPGVTWGATDYMTPGP